MSDLLEQARELATHAAEIKHLQADMDKMVNDMEEIKKAISEINRTLSEAKGGWKVLMWAGGAVSAITAAVGFFTGRITH